MKYTFVIFSAMALSLAVSCTKMDDRLPSDDSHGSGNIMADPSSYKENMLRIKVSEPYADRLASLEGSDGVVSSVKSSAVFGDPNILYMKRTFNKGGKYEQRRRSYGLHLWYDVYLDNTSALTKSQSLFSETEGVEIIELVPIGKLDGTAVPLERMNLPAAPEKKAALPFDDPMLSMQWHYLNDGSLQGSVAGCDVDIVPLWNEGVKGSPDVVVAVIDGAVDVEHEDLVANIWVNEAELNGQPGVDDDNNGYIDDVHGYNFYNDNAALEYHDHGTHVAGVIGAVNNNGIGVSGIAGGDAKNSVDGVKIMTCALFGNNNEFGNFADAMAYAADNGAVIAQNSWSYGSRETQLRPSDKVGIDYYIDNAGSGQGGKMEGGIVIFAAGNNSMSIGYPAAYEKVMAVASVAADYEKASTSNYGDWIDIAAPGGDGSKDQQVTSTITTASGKYGEMFGTSMACPHVSAVAALIIAENEDPGFTPEKLRDKLVNSARNIDAYNKGEAHEGMIGSLVNAYNAVLRTDSDEAPETVSDLSLSVQSNNIYAEWTPVSDLDEGMAYGFALCYSTSEIDVSAGADNLPAGTVVAEFESEDYNPSIKARGHVLAGFETDYYVTMYAYDLTGNRSGLSPIQKITTGKNTPPLIEPSSVEIELGRDETRDVVLSVSDPDGHSFSWDAVRASEALVVEQTSDDEITLHFDGSKAAIRTHKGSVTVTDRYGASTTADIIYTITGIYPPELIKEFNDVRMTGNMKQVGFDLSEYFKDADNEILSYSATASVEGIVEFEIDSDNLIIRKLEEGITDVTVRASDSKGDYAEDTFTVNTGIDPGSGSVSVSPNPAVDYVEVRMSVPSDDADIKLVNPLGHVVYAAEGVEISMSSPCRIGLEGLAAGTYSVSVTSSGRTETARFVKL